MDTAGLKDGTAHLYIKFSHLSTMLTLKSPQHNTSRGFSKPHSRGHLHAVVRPARIWRTSGALCHDSFGCCRYLCTERLARTSSASAVWAATSDTSTCVGAFAI